MMKPQVERARHIPSLLVVGLVSAISGAVAGTLATSFMLSRSASPPPPAPAPAPDVHSAGMTTGPAASYRQIDVMSPTAFAPDGAPDDVYDLDITSDRPIVNLFIVREEQGLQWDTVDGHDRIPYGRTFGGREGAVTWYLGVRENGRWLNAPTSKLAPIPAGRHKLELVATAPQGAGPRVIAVMFSDGAVTEVPMSGPLPVQQAY